VSVGRYRIVVPGNAPDWMQQLGADFNSVLLRIARDMRPRRYLLADLPRDGSETVAIVTNEAGGITLAFYDIDNNEWRRVQDRAVCS
jgi:hypothetical protein